MHILVQIAGPLRARRERPRYRRAADEPNELAATTHSITSVPGGEAIKACYRPSIAWA
jgi:hypothetical protein